MREAYDAYLDTIPEVKRQHSVSYEIKDIVGRAGFGIGSAGLPAYNLLIEGRTQALENDVVLSMKQGNVAAPSRVVTRRGDPRRLRAPGPPHRGLAARAAGARRPVAGLVRAARQGPARQGALALRGRPRLGRRLRARRDHARCCARSGRRPRRCTASRTPAPTRRSSTSRPRRRSSRPSATRTTRSRADLADFGAAYGELARDDHRRFVDSFRNGAIPGLDGLTRAPRAAAPPPLGRAARRCARSRSARSLIRTRTVSARTPSGPLGPLRRDPHAVAPAPRRGPRHGVGCRARRSMLARQRHAARRP